MSAQMFHAVSDIKASYDKTILINALISHLEKHQSEYAEAIKVYRVKVEEKLIELLEKVKFNPNFNSFPVNPNLGLVTPIDCSSGYKKIIGLFQQVKDDSLVLNMDEANRILNNEWDWAVSAYATNSQYLK